MTIKELRTQAGMTRQEFADYLGMSRRSTEKWETGERNCPAYLFNLILYKFEKEGLIADAE